MIKEYSLPKERFLKCMLSSKLNFNAKKAKGGAAREAAKKSFLLALPRRGGGKALLTLVLSYLKLYFSVTFKSESF